MWIVFINGVNESELLANAAASKNLTRSGLLKAVVASGPIEGGLNDSGLVAQPEVGDRLVSLDHRFSGFRWRSTTCPGGCICYPPKAAGSIARVSSRQSSGRPQLIAGLEVFHDQMHESWGRRRPCEGIQSMEPRRTSRARFPLDSVEESFLNWELRGAAL
jgi:hypothetical protein